MQRDLFANDDGNANGSRSQGLHGISVDPANANASRVGARHGTLPPVPQVGGYSPSCNASDFAVGGEAAAPAPPAGADPASNDDRDPRIEELRQMGLGTVWVRVADTIGFENFMAAWHVMSINRDFMDKRNRLTIPDVSLYFHYQRRQEIRALGLQGYGVKQIQQHMLQSAGEKLSEFQVMHVLRQLPR